MMFASIFLKRVAPLLLGIILQVFGVNLYANEGLALADETDDLSIDPSDSPQIIGKNIFGLVRDYQNSPVIIEEAPLIHTNPDHNVDLNVVGRRFDISVFGGEISTLYLTHYNRKRNRKVDTLPLKLDPVSGITSVEKITPAPWGSVLMSEAALVDANSPENFTKSFSSYFKGKEQMVNPYNYGWLTEAIVLDELGTSKVIKHYAVGRLAASEFAVLSDGTGLFLLDGHHSGNLYYFAVQEKGSLSRGTLYLVSEDLDQLKFVEMGNTSSLKIKFSLKKTTFDKVIDLQVPVEGGCATGYQYTETVLGQECIKLVKRAKKFAAFLEPIRVAAVLNLPNYSEHWSKLSVDESGSKLNLGSAGGLEKSFDLNLPAATVLAQTVGNQ